MIPGQRNCHLLQNLLLLKIVQGLGLERDPVPQPQQGLQYAKRSIGVGVFNIKHLFRHGVTGDQVVSIWTPALTNASADTLNSTDDWDEIIRDLVSSPTSAYTRCKPVEHVHLAFQSFADPDAKDLIDRTPTLPPGHCPYAKDRLSRCSN